MKNNSGKNRILISTIVTLSVLLVGLFGASYAFFAATIDSESTSSVTVTAKTVDSLTFVKGGGYKEYRTGSIKDDTNMYTTSAIHQVSGGTGIGTKDTGGTLTFTVNQTNFGDGTGDMCTYVTPYVQLKAKNNASSTYNFTAALKLTEDTITYTTTEKTPELTLYVIKEEYNTAYSASILAGTTAAASKTVLYDGIDMTCSASVCTTSTTPKINTNYFMPTSQGTALSTTSVKHSITAAKNKTKLIVFRTEICFKNLDADQSTNAGKSITGTFVLTKA